MKCSPHPPVSIKKKILLVLKLYFEKSDYPSQRVTAHMYGLVIIGLDFIAMMRTIRRNASGMVETVVLAVTQSMTGITTVQIANV